MMDIDPAQLNALTAAVGEGTFDAAARVLHVTPSAVSQRIKALEISVGRVLVVRTKPVRVTEAGEALLRLARQINSLTDDFAREIGSDSSVEQAQIALGVNADSLATWVLPALARLTESMTFTFYCDDESHTAELLREGTVMAAISSSSRPPPGCGLERLGVMRYQALASPHFFQRWFAGGVTAVALSTAPVVTYDLTDDLHERVLRRHSRKTLRPPRHHVPSPSDFLNAVCLGYGWGLIPKIQVDNLPANPDLIDLDPGRSVDVPLNWHHWRLPSHAMKRVTDALHTAAKSCLV